MTTALSAPAAGLAQRLTDPDLTDAERAALHRDYGYEIAADFGIDAYGTRVLPIGGAR